MPKAKDEWFKARRLLVMAELLRDRPHTVAQLCRVFHDQATPRDVQRDLKDLELCVKGFQRLRARPPRYIIQTQANTLHPIQTLAVHSATRLVYHRASGHSSHYSGALELLRRWLPERIQAVVQRSTRDIGKRNSRESLALEKVASAWFNGHRLKFQYQSGNGSGQWRSNELEVYFVEVHPSNLGLYAVGLETSFHHAHRTFKLSRMRQLEVLRDTSYSIPEDFDPKTFFQGAWGVLGKSDGQTISIKLRFAPEAARRLDEGGYPNMSLRSLDDGSSLVTVQAGVDKSGLPLEVLSWVRSWGPRVEVLEPAPLRQRWLEDARRLLELHGS